MQNFFALEANNLLYADTDNGAPRLYLLQAGSNLKEWQLRWTTALDKASGSIALTQPFYGVEGQQHSRVAYDINGCFYLLDTQRQQTTFVHHYQRQYCHAVVLSDGKTLAVLSEKSHHDHQLDLWQFAGDELTFSQTLKLEFADDDIDEDEVGPYPFYDIKFTDPLFAGPDNSLIVACSGDYRHSDDEWRPAQFGLRLSIDRDAGVAWEYEHNLDAPPQDWSHKDGRVAVDTDSGLLALPTMTIDVDADGRWLSQIDLIDSTQFGSGNNALVQRLTVRAFSADELDDITDPNDDDHRQAFLERISALHFADGKVWVVYSDGAVRGLSVDGQWRSPLFAAAEKTDANQRRNFFLERGLVQWPSAEQPALVFDDWHHRHWFSLDSNAMARLSGDSAGLDDWCLLPDDQQHWQDGWAASAEQQIDLALVGRTVLEVFNLNSDVGVGFALKRLVVKCEDIAELCHGNRLIIALSDGKQVWNEERFFARAIEVKDGAAQMAEILEHFIDYADADNCFGEGDKPALADCALQLGLSDARWLPLISRYLNAIDPDHEAFFASEGVFLLEERHGDSEQWDEFYQSLPAPIGPEEDWDEDDDFFSGHQRSDEEIRAAIPAELLSQLADMKQRALEHWQQKLDAVANADSADAIGELLDDWLIESHNTKRDPDIGSFEYNHLDDWLKSGEQKALEAQLETYLQHPIEGLAISETDLPNIFISQYLDALFNRAEELQAWPQIEGYLRAQIDWLIEIDNGNGWYEDETPYGNYAAEALLRHSDEYGPLYAEYLATLTLAVPEETVGEFLREIIPQRGINQHTYPVILARLTHAADQWGRDDFSTWCEQLNIAQWLTDNDKVEQFFAAVQEDFARYSNDADDIAEDVNEVREALGL